jgi:hypothetical protein
VDRTTRKWRDRRKSKPGNGAGETTRAGSDTHGPRRRLASEAAAAEVLNVSPQSLRNARCTGTGDLATLKWYKIGPKILYDMDYLEGPWLEQRRRGSAA